MARDLYQTLGVKRGASDDEIRRAYRKLARKHHPDVNPGDKHAEERFKEVSAAYEVLSDKEKRNSYDEFGEEALRGGFDPEKARAYRRWQGARRQAGRPFEEELGEVDLGDLFRRRRRGMRGQDVHGSVEIDLAQALSGIELSVEVPTRPQPIKVRIPPGADDGSRLRVTGQGAPGVAGGEPGDLIIETHVRPHPFFRREGMDLHLTLPITLAEALHGTSIEVPTPGGPVKLTIPPRSQSGQKLRLRGRGVARGGQRGDLYAELSIQLPDEDVPGLGEAARTAERAYRRSVREGIRL